MGSEPQPFDVAIIGGGPAGSSTALHLVRAMGKDPRRIVILDRARHPRDKPCGGAVSAWGLDALRRVRVAVTVPNVVIEGVRILLDGEVGRTRSASMGIVIRRPEFDAALLDHARRDGVTVRDGEGLVAMAREAHEWQLVTSRGGLAAKIVCACDGAGSQVRKLLGFGEAARKGHLFVTDTLPSPSDVGVSSDFCDFDMTPTRDGVDGYYWDFPTLIDGRRMVNRGIYHANLERSESVRSRSLKSVLARFLVRRQVDLETIKLHPFATRPLTPDAPLSRDGVVLVGEAAGIDRVTGEGIAQAILYGELAARHVVGALNTGSRDFEDYASEVRASQVGRHLRQSAWLAARVFSPSGEPFRKLLVHSSAAREAGVRWYRGERVGRWTTMRLGLGLAREAVS